VPQPNDHAQAYLIALSLAGVCLGLYGFFHRWKQRRWLQDTPEARMRSAPQGYLRLSGRAKSVSGKPLRAPLTGRACVWWKYSVRPQNRRSGTSESDTSTASFLLTDEGDSCLIDPAGADVEPSDRRVWSGDSPRTPGLPSLSFSLLGSDNQYRYTEEIIVEDARLSVLGELRSGAASVTNCLEDEVAAKLAEWKADQTTLLARFDANHDGRIDPAEWERARAAARAEVQQGQLQQAPTEEMHRVEKPTEGRPYLIAALSPEKLAAKDGYRALGSLGLTLVSLVMACYLLARL
jgi:hypothetical protein